MRTLVIGALACALSVSACSKVGDQTGAGAARTTGTIPGELRVAIPRSPNTLNPILSAFTIEGFLNRLTFDNLITHRRRRKASDPRPRDRSPDVAERRDQQGRSDDHVPPALRA